jgi:hypothetical protein
MKKQLTVSLAVLAIAFIATIGTVLALDRGRGSDDAQPDYSIALGAPVTRIVEVSIARGELAGGIIRSRQNDVLLLKITSDQDEQFHVDGYHAFATLKRNRRVNLEVWTATPGQFPIYLDKQKKLIGHLEVTPAP